jgi:DNA polymerase-3 subunit delta'
MSFIDIRGQVQAVGLLKNSLQHSAIAGAYLFIGQEGVGKYLSAVNFAKAINCLGKNNDACDSCISCKKIEKRQHPDVHFIEPQESGAIKIEHIRDLKKEISFRPYEAKKKVFIINDAHNLTAEASNALLKTLEEPARDSLVILITAKPNLLFKTVISRCQIIKFRPLPRRELEEILNRDYHLDKLGAHYLAYFSEGRLGRALKMKESDILRSKNRVIDEFAIRHRTGSFEKLNPEKKEDIRECLNVLASWFRDIYLVKAGLAHSEIINLDRKDELLGLMSRYSWLDLDVALDVISDSISYLEHNINTKLLLLNLKVQICHG